MKVVFYFLSITQPANILGIWR